MRAIDCYDHPHSNWRRFRAVHVRLRRATRSYRPVKPGPTPNEANFFIATPPGWTQPKTPWGDPDLQGIWPISYVGTVSLQRCVPAFGARPPAGSPPCDPHKAFLTARRI